MKILNCKSVNEYVIECEHCGHLQRVEIEDATVEDLLHIYCEKCGKNSDGKQKSKDKE
jgi:ribosomal protein L37E